MWHNLHMAQSKDHVHKIETVMVWPCDTITFCNYENVTLHNHTCDNNHVYMIHCIICNKCIKRHYVSIIMIQYDIMYDIMQAQSLIM